MISPKEACEVNGLKVVAAIVVVILIGVMIWQYMPVEVETGTVEVCGNNLHQGEREISRQVEIKRVPRWQSSNYRVTENVVDCESCKEEVRRQSLEAERQARIAREATERSANASRILQLVAGGFEGDWGSTSTTVSLKPGQYLPSLRFVIEYHGDKPLPAGTLGLVISPSDNLILDIPPDEADGFINKKWYTEYTQTVRSFWRGLTGSGYVISQTINPSGSPYYSGDQYSSGNEFDFDDVVRLSPQAKPGTDVCFSGYVVVEKNRKLLGTVTIHVMHP
jgi:hypothetical protein